MESTIRVAIADDHEIVLNGVKSIILSFGEFSVDFVASNGKEMYDKLLAAESLPDIVVLDVSMPVWDGYATLDAIKKKWPDMKVLILTMHKHELGIIKMFRSGASGYLLKNSPPKELKKALQSIVENGLYFSELVSGNFLSRMQQTNILPSLSEREIQLLKLCPTDLTYHEIAAKMGIPETTVAGHRMSLFEKFGVNSRTGLVICAIQMGLIQVE